MGKYRYLLIVSAVVIFGIVFTLIWHKKILNIFIEVPKDVISVSRQMIEYNEADQEIQNTDLKSTNKFFSKKEIIHLYYATKDASNLTSEERIVEKLECPVKFAKNLLLELFNGSEDDNFSILPKGNFIRSLFLSDEGIFYLDLKDEIFKYYPGGASMELLSVYSLVNTLILNIPEIKKVKIIVNGKEKQTFNGHIDIRHPLKSNMTIVR